MDPGAAEATAVFLMNRHGLGEWRFAWDRSAKRFGACHHGPRTITLSRDLVSLNSVDEVVETILHEIAHAKVGPAHGHDDVWRAFARSIGCKGDRCYGEDVVQVPGKWQLICARCGYVEQVHKEPRSGPYTHKRCGGRMAARRAPQTFR